MSYSLASIYYKAYNAYFYYLPSSKMIWFQGFYVIRQLTQYSEKNQEDLEPDELGSNLSAVCQSHNSI